MRIWNNDIYISIHVNDLVINYIKCKNGFKYVPVSALDIRINQLILVFRLDQCLQIKPQKLRVYIPLCLSKIIISTSVSSILTLITKYKIILTLRTIYKI
jgi:hypothetical protein